jgi:hypothetical protein
MPVWRAKSAAPPFNVAEIVLQFFTASQDKEGRAWAIPRGARLGPSNSVIYKINSLDGSGSLGV